MKFNLRPQQQLAIEALNKDIKLLVLPTGMGKTLTAFHYIKQFKKTKTLYITENNLLPQISEDHLKFYNTKENILTIRQVAEPKRIEAFNKYQEEDTLDILAFNYHTMVSDTIYIQELIQELQKQNYTVIIIADEVEIVRHSSSKFHQELKTLMKLANKQIGMTASPAKSGLMEIYNLLLVVNNKPLMPLEKFYKKYCDINIQHNITFSANGKRLGYPVIKVSPIQQPTTQITIQGHFLRNLPKNNKPTKAISNCVIAHAGYEIVLHIKTNYKGSFKLEHKGIEISGYSNPIKKIIAYKNIDKFHKLTKKHMFSGEKDKEIPSFKLKHKILEDLTKDSREFQALQTLAKDLKEAIPYATETIATITPSIISYEYGEALQVQEDIVLKAILKDTNTYIKKEEQVIVFTKYTKIADYFSLVLDKNHKHISYNIIQGGMSKKNLTIAKEDFQSNQIDLLILTEAGLRGLNLQCCKNILVLDMPKSYGDLTQLAGRVARIGSTHKKLYLHLYTIKDTILEDFYKLIFGQGCMIKMYNPNLIEKGLYDKTIEPLALDETEAKYFRKGLKNRIKKYLKK